MGGSSKDSEFRTLAQYQSLVHQLRFVLFDWSWEYRHFKIARNERGETGEHFLAKMAEAKKTIKIKHDQLTAWLAENQEALNEALKED